LGLRPSAPRDGLRLLCNGTSIVLVGPPLGEVTRPAGSGRMATCMNTRLWLGCSNKQNGTSPNTARSP
jgi:hypothetical protein